VGGREEVAPEVVGREGVGLVAPVWVEMALAAVDTRETDSNTGIDRDSFDI